MRVRLGILNYNMKKICLVESLGSGGAERQMMGLAVLLKQEGYDVEVWYYAPNHFYCKNLENEGVKFRYILEAQNKELEKQTKVHISNYEELYRIAQQQEKQIQENEKETIKKYHFRNKTVSWRGDSSVVETEKSEFIHNKNTSAFLNMYYSNNLTNDSCFNCCFTSQDRVSDLTISDFWGIEKDNPHFEDKLGVSMVMVNTSKGKTLFDALDGEKAEANIDNAKQPQLSQPPSKPQGYEMFWQKYKESGIEYAVKNFGIPKTNLKSKIYNLIKGK